MSKLYELLKAADTGNRKALPTPSKYTTVESKIRVHDNSYDLRIGIVYDVSCKFSTRVVIPEDELDKQYYTDQAKRVIIEEVFGEFRPLIVEMRSAMVDEDRNRLRLLTAELEAKMFGTF